MIREANFFDINRVLDIGRELYTAAINHNTMYQWDDAKAIAVCKHFISSNDSIVLIDENKGSITGFFIGQLTTPPCYVLYADGGAFRTITLNSVEVQ